jgi:hypothetical protein
MVYWIQETSVLFFLGLFIYFVFVYCINKESFVSKRNPYIEESKHFHY